MADAMAMHDDTTISIPVAPDSASIALAGSISLLDWLPGRLVAGVANLSDLRGGARSQRNRDASYALLWTYALSGVLILARHGLDQSSKSRANFLSGGMT